MRDIKFRGYDEENKIWRYGFYYRGTNGGARIANYIITDDSVMYYIHHEKSIGQFAGLTDKNGVDIYESDILKDDEGYNREVTIGTFGVDLDGYDTGDYYYGQDPSGFPWEKFEAIGNKVENPELLN